MTDPIPINQGGLLRCCIADVYNNSTATEEGSLHVCQHCGSHLKISEGAWKWDRDPYEKEVE